jgi:hypothetical protein
MTQLTIDSSIKFPDAFPSASEIGISEILDVNKKIAEFSKEAFAGSYTSTPTPPLNNKERYYSLGFYKEDQKSYDLLFRRSKPWMKEGVKEDLSSWKGKGITKEAIKEAFITLNKKYTSPIALISIKKGSIKVSLPDKELDHSQGLRHKTLVSYLEHLLKVQALPNMDFLLLLQDGYTSEEIIKPNVPVFAFTKPQNNKDFVLIPDGHSLRSLSQHGYASYTWKKDFYDVLKQKKQLSWSKTIPKIMWRGRLSDSMEKYNKINFSKFPRGKLLLLSRENKNLIDAKATYGKYQLMQELEALRMVDRKFTPKEKQLHYRYHLVLDGVTCTYPGLHWRLLSNGVVIKQKSDQVQWFYRALLPNIHYVPVRHDLSNLKKVVEHLKENDSKAKTIAINGSNFALDNLNFEAIAQYVHLVLKNYATMF